MFKPSFPGLLLFLGVLCAFHLSRLLYGPGAFRGRRQSPPYYQLPPEQECEEGKGRQGQILTDLEGERIEDKLHRVLAGGEVDPAQDMIDGYDLRRVAVNLRIPPAVILLS